MSYAIDVFKDSNHPFSFRREVELKAQKRKREREGFFCQYFTRLLYHNILNERQTGT
jgi:hypothetical protein